MKRLLAIFLLTYSAYANAMHWIDLWLRADQQGMGLLKQGKAEQAATTFQDPQWQGVAYYRAGHYQQAMRRFRQQDSADASYNHGNALALQGDYRAALNAYATALKLAPQHADAKYNYQLVKQLLQQQTSQNKQSDNKDQQQYTKQLSQDHSQAKQPDSKQQQTSSDKQDQPQGSKQLASDKNQPNQTDNKQQPSKEQDSTQQNNQPKFAKDKQDVTKSNPTSVTKQQKTVDTLKKQTGKTDKPMTSSETQQANEQWLRQIPDDPGGLLRQKFLRDYEQMQR